MRLFRIAIVVDGHMVSEPFIREPIVGGVGQVSGAFTIAEVTELAASLRSRTCLRLTI